MLMLHATFFAWPAAIVWDWRTILDDGNFQANSLQGADGRLTARPGPFDPNFDFTHPVGHRLPSSVLRHLLGSESRALARTFKTHPAGAGPSDDVSLHVRNRDLGIIERRKDICD